MILLYCIITLVIGVLAGAVAHYVFGKSPDPHEVTVGKAVLQYLSIKDKDFPTDYYRANFKSCFMGDSQLLDATAGTLPEVLYVLFDHLFGTFRHRGARVQRLIQELQQSQYQGRCQEAALRDLNKRLARGSIDLAIYKDQVGEQGDRLFAHAEEIESLAKVIQDKLG